MATTGILPSQSTSLTSSPLASSPAATKSLNANDFINLMVTQLQHQDPTQPESNDQLLAQMSQIAQLQSSTQLQTSLSQMVLQNQISSAGSLIGKSVQGLDDQANQLTGVVTSVRVQQNQVYLQLDNGGQLQMGNVTAITAPAGSTSAGASTNTAAKSA